MLNTFRNKVILITGGAGSIGSEIALQLTKYPVKQIRIYDINETGLFYLKEKLKYSNKIRYFLGDIKDKERLLLAMKNVDYVFHAAALKHVPLCEYNPMEAVKTNVYGLLNTINSARESKVKKFIFISTDKAVNPTNIMGTTKLLGEKIVINSNIGKGTFDTVFSCVRFGNVLNSNGSVIPLFAKQISSKGPVTVTDKNMTRFFMSLEDSTKLIIKAAEIAQGREIFILKMKSMNILDLAEVMINILAPKYNYNPKDIKLNYIGLRPGEKLNEELVTSEESSFIEDKGKFYIVHPPIIQPDSEIIIKRFGVYLSRKEYDSTFAEKISKDEIKKIINSLIKNKKL